MTVELVCRRRVERALKPGPRETGESKPSRLLELTGRWQRPVMENGLLSTSHQRHAERTLTAMDCHGCVDSVKSELISLTISTSQSIRMTAEMQSGRSLLADFGSRTSPRLPEICLTRNSDR